MHVRGEIPNGWSEMCLKDIAMIDKESLKETTLNDYKFSYISLSDVNKGSISNQLSEYNFLDAPSRARRVVRQYDVLMSTVRPNLQAFCRIQDDVKDIVASTGFAVITPKVKTDSEYIYQYLYSLEVVRQVYALVVGSNYPAINSSDLKKLKVLFPNKPVERIKIAKILSTWDKAAEKLEALIIAKQQRKKALMHQLLTGRKRFAGFNREWSTYYLSELFLERNESGFNDLNLLSITREKGVIPRDEVERKDTSNDDKSKYRRICPGDIGYNTMRMWQGVSAFSEFEGIVSPAYTICVPQKHIDGKFAAFLFKTPAIMNLFFRYSQGLTSDTWNLKFRHFSEIKITIPEKAEQQKIAFVLSAADTEIETHKKQLSALKEQKTGLMQQLLTGKKRVQLDEVA
jgi:type I restriction enzyme S subunit